MPTPRLYLFYGADSRASGQAVKRWQALFDKKYQSHTRYVIEADELDLARFKSLLAERLEGQALFPEPKLIVVKRVTSQEKGNSTAWTAAFKAGIEQALPYLDDSVTVAAWEEQGLRASHSLLMAFLGWEKEGKAKVNRFDVPTAGRVGKVAAAYVAEAGLTLGPEGTRWISDQYAFLEKGLRLSRRLKTQDELLEDDRAWWLYQLLDGAILRAEGGAVTLEALQAGHATLWSPVSPFDIATALTNRQWVAVFKLLIQFERDAEGDSSYYGLLAALRWQLKRSPGRLTQRQAAHAELLLAEVELIGKNTTADLAWLVTLAVTRMQEAEGGVEAALVRPRQLWLAQLPRS